MRAPGATPRPRVLRRVQPKAETAHIQASHFRGTSGPGPGGRSPV